MSEPDPVLSELDAEIRRIEAVIERANADLRTAREMRAWWAERHPIVVGLGQAVEVEVAAPIEVLRGTRSLRDLILVVLEESGRSARTVPEIRDRATELGWETTSENKGTMVRNYLRQLMEEGRVTKFGTGAVGSYRLAKVDAVPAQPG